MKKLLVLCLLSSLVSFAATSEDVNNAQFLADQDIIVKQSTTAGYRLDSTITRAEAIGIALKIKGVALPSYQCQGYFSDVQNNDWICRAAEISADSGLVTRANTKFRPQDNITRAEALAIIMKGGNINIELFNRSYFSRNWVGYSDVYWTDHSQFTADWQRDVFFSYMKNVNLDIPGQIKMPPSDSGHVSFNYRVNSSATRAEVFGFAKNILGSEKLTNTQMNCEIEGVQVYGECKIDHGDIWYGKYIEAPVYGDNLYRGPECAISYENQGSYIIGSPKPGKYGNIEYIDMSYLENGMRIVLGNSGYYEISSPGNIDNCMDVSLRDIRKLTAEDVFDIYYGNLDKSRNMGVEVWAYRMRSPTGVSEEIFISWYKNVTSVVFREDTMKNLGDNTYEFLVDMTENGVKSTYKVKSKVDLENFKINNISSVKQ